MSHSIKLGIVGFGRIVELIHLPLIKQVPEMEVSVVYDITEQRRDLAAKRGFHTTDKLETLLESDVDVVLVSTPPNSHYEIAKKALVFGKHVVIEKPVTVQYSEAIDLQQTSEQVGKSVTVFHNRRFDPDFKLIRQLIEDGTLGNLLFVERRHHMFGSGGSFGVKSFHPGWRNTRQYGGGALYDWGIHLIDQLLQLKAGVVQDIYSFIHCYEWTQNQVDDYVRANLVMDNHVVLSMEVNFASHGAAPMWVVGGDQRTAVVVSPQEALLLEKGKPDQKLHLDQASRSSALIIYQSLAEHVMHGGPLAVTLEEAVENMRVVDAIMMNNRQWTAQN
ncbi:Gfo/Idh/MocA family protein [Marinicrinis lubricantis]|uniref:Gfo/Idh/MocA family protein n=1 Tax=Marinicrinis lubricantis TaxID=2086470 RepID=A0ABW1ISF8_9BACL